LVLKLILILTIMKHIQIESIEKAIEIVDNASDERLEEVINQYAELQPALLDYVLAAPTEYENDDLEGLILYYFWIIIEAFVQEGVAVNEITDDMIADFQEPFAAVLDAYFESDDEATEQELEDFCDQPHLTQFMSVEVSTEDEDGTTLDEETATQLFIVCLGMIALLNRAIKA